MKIAYITAGAAGMYCGTCMHDNTLAASLMDRGHEVSLLPVYTPMRTDEKSVAGDRVFFGALNAYLQHKFSFFRHTPRFFDRWLDNPKLLNWIASMGAASNDAKQLGSMTLSIVQGEKGPQRKELEKLADFLADFVQPEVVHLSFTLFAGFARLLKERLNVPIICSLQGEDLFFEELPEPYRSRIVREITERVQEIDAFAAPCQYYADTMSRDYGIPADRIFPARLGIHSDDFTEPAARTHDGIHIGYLARICPEKGLHHLVDAFIALCSDSASASGHGLRLRVAGFLSAKDEAYFDDQRSKISEAGLDNQADWIGEVDRAGKIEFLNSLDLLSVPTVYREPKGLFVAEALASGVPVVLPDHGGFPEWIERTGGGELFEANSVPALARTLRSLIDDEARRQQYAVSGRRAILEHFNEQAMADEMLENYRQVLSQDRDVRLSA